MVFGDETLGQNCNAYKPIYIDIFLDVQMPCRLLAYGESLVHGGAALAMPEFVHRESIERLKKTRAQKCYHRPGGNSRALIVKRHLILVPATYQLRSC